MSLIVEGSTFQRDAIPHAGTPYIMTSGDSTTISQTVTLPAEGDERAYVSVLWASDWDSAEDAAYDRY